MKRYSEYKDSGVEFIGEIPEYWVVSRIKNIFMEINERSNDGSELLLSVSEYYGVAPRKGKIEEDEWLSRADTLEGYKKCEKDDLVMNIMLAWKRSFGVSNFDGIVSPAYAVFRLKKDDLPKYFHFLFRTDLFISEFKRNSTGIIDSRLRLYPDSFFRISTILPPLPEQKSIATFLDRKTTQIDALIEKKEKQIELLKEYRTAIINHSVTKGLNPNVKMKDSGIERLGEIPEHWKEMGLKYTIDGGLTNGIFKKKDQFGEGVKLINVVDIYQDDYFINFDTLGRVKTDDKENIKYQVKNGDIFFVRSSLKLEGIGISCCIGEVSEPTVFECHVIRLRPEKSQAYPEFLIHSLNAYYSHQRFIAHSETVTMTTISQPKISSLKVVIPPLNEQKEIIRIIKYQKQKIGTLIKNNNLLINQLKEYRTSLISDAVTGKIDVRSEV